MIFNHLFIFFLSLSLLTILLGFGLKHLYIKKGMVINPFKILDFDILIRADARKSNQTFKDKLFTLKVILITQIAFFILALFFWIFTNIETDPRELPVIVTPNYEKFP